MLAQKSYGLFGCGAVSMRLLGRFQKARWWGKTRYCISSVRSAGSLCPRPRCHWHACLELSVTELTSQKNA